MLDYREKKHCYTPVKINAYSAVQWTLLHALIFPQNDRATYNYTSLSVFILFSSKFLSRINPFTLPLIFILSINMLRFVYTVKYCSTK